jgi:hypothetical protein
LAAVAIALCSALFFTCTYVLTWTFELSRGSVCAMLAQPYPRVLQASGLSVTLFRRDVSIRTRVDRRPG